MQTTQPVTLEHVKECALILQHTFRNKDANERRQAEQALNKLSDDPDRFMEILILLIIHNESNELLDQTKDAAATYLSLMLKTKRFGEDVSSEQRYAKASLLFQAMIQEHLKLSYRIHLGACLTQLLLSKAEKIKKNLFPAMLASMKSNSKGMAGGLIALQSITDTTNQAKKIVSLFKESVEPLTELGGMLVEAVNNELGSISTINASNEAEKSAKILALLESLRVWADTIKNFVIKFNEKAGTLLEEVIDKKGLMIVFINILCIYLKTDMQVKECYISTSGLERLDTLLNEIKIKIMRCLNILTIFMFDVRSFVPIRDSKCYELMPTLLPLVVSTMINFCRAPNIDLIKVLDNPSYESLLMESLVFLTVVGKQKEYYPVFANHKKTLIADVVFPLMRIGNMELEYIQDNPKDFVYLAIDTCDNQKSETVKTQTAQFLETLCDHIDGSLTFTAVFCFAALEYSLLSNNTEEIPTKFGVLSDYTDCIFITKTTPITRVETCLLITAMLSYALPLRNDLLSSLEKTLTTYKDYFLQNQDPIIRSRYCLVLSYYYEKLFTSKKQRELLGQQIYFLVETVGLKDEKYQIAVIQACDGLKSIFEDEDMASKISPFVEEIIKKFIMYVSYVKIPEFFDILHEIARTYGKHIVKTPELLILLVKILSLQVQTELKAEKPSNQGKIIIAKCWNIIRAIGENKVYLPVLDSIEEPLLPLFEFMQTPEKISFDEEIIALMSAMIKLQEKVSNTKWILVSTFPKVFEKNKYIFYDLFHAINLVIVHGCETLKNRSDLIEMFIDLACKAIFCNDKKSTEGNQAEGAVMLQLIMQYLGPQLNLTQWQKIIITVLERLNMELKTNSLKARLLGVILHGFMVNYKVTEEILQSKEMVGPVIAAIIQNPKIFTHSYDKKVFVLGVSSIFIQDKLSPFVSERIKELFVLAVSMLKIIQSIEEAEILRRKVKAKAKQKKKSDDDSDDEEVEKIPTNEQIFDSILLDLKRTDEAMQNVSNRLSQPENGKTGEEKKRSDLEEEEKGGNDMDDDSDDDMNYLHADDDAVADATLDKLITDFKKKDEFEVFKSIVMKIKEVNEAGLKEIIQSMPESKQDYLKQVLQSHRVVIDKTENKTIARKIVKVKGKKEPQKP